MKPAAPDPALQAKAEALYAGLAAAYGEREWQPGEDPVDALIGTILSANTNDVNSGRAFDQLVAAYDHDWDQIRNAPLEEIKRLIRPAGMYNQKAPAIVATLNRLWEAHGRYDLWDLAVMPLAEAMAFLTSLPGVGNKTAGIVMLFCFNRGAFPVDTHIQRISQRVGLCGRKAPPDKITPIWQQLLPPEKYYALHLNLIAHGRGHCNAQRPQCERCPLQELCDYWQQAGEWRPV